MIKIGITGQSGFIGTHLCNTIKLFSDEFELESFDDSYFESQEALDGFIDNCGVIVHLAAVNRHDNEEELYRINIELTEKLICALNKSKNCKHVLFSSSTQEERDNLYGKAKREGRKKLQDWANFTGNAFSGLIIPNVFGPFGKPFYNSVIATFSHQLINGLKPHIDVDAELNLIYVSDLTKNILEIIQNRISGEIKVLPNCSIKVSKVLSYLNSFHDKYFLSGEIPELKNSFEVNLFNTYKSFIPLESFFPFKYRVNSDTRGVFIETMRLGVGGQISYSTTIPGIIRGNHFHTRKIERFAVIKGKAKISMRKVGTSKVYDFFLAGEEPAFVDMPVWFTHNLVNIGDDELITLFWINEFYDPNDSDTYFENV